MQMVGGQLPDNYKVLDQALSAYRRTKHYKEAIPHDGVREHPDKGFDVMGSFVHGPSSEGCNKI
jgi:hypothetical protein